MSKVKTFVSEVGEVFEGTTAELCREYGIKRRSSVTSPGGAKATDGTRWVLEALYELNGGIQKEILYLGERVVWEQALNGGVERVTLSPSETANIYTICEDAIKRGNVGGLTKEECEEYMLNTKSRYDIIDNRVKPVVVVDYDKQRAELKKSKPSKEYVDFFWPMVFTQEDLREYREVRDYKSKAFDIGYNERKAYTDNMDNNYRAMWDAKLQLAKRKASVKYVEETTT